MTTEEINALTLQDVEDSIRYRCFMNLDPIPESEEEFATHDEMIAWRDSHLTQEMLDVEFLAYKEELLEIENERIRREELQAIKNGLRARFEGLEDMRAAFHTLHPDKPNPASFLEEVLKNEDIVAAEAAIAALEAKDAELKAEREAVEYMDKRKSEYPTIEELIVAMWEGDQTAIDELEAKRQEVKTKYPKPTS